MNKASVLYQPMGMRMNGIMNGITEEDEDYQALLREVDKYTLQLEAMQLIEQYVCRYVAIGSHYGMLAYLLGFSDCRELLGEPAFAGMELPAQEHP